MRRRIAGRVAVITGASSGIGLETALHMAREGARVVVAARRADRLSEARAAVERLGALCLAVRTDVTSPPDVQRLLDATIEHFGGVDIWINNAGSGMVAWFEDTDAEDVRRLFEVNFFGAMLGCRVALQQMRRQESGHIINVSSLAGRFALPLNSAYAATKHALNALGQALSCELEGTGIYVSTIMPGLTETGFFGAMLNKVPTPPNRSIVRAAPASSVASAIVRCAKRPRTEVVLAPGGRMSMLMAEAFPALFRYIGRRYLAVRAGGPRLE